MSALHCVLCMLLVVLGLVVLVLVLALALPGVGPFRRPAQPPFLNFYY